MKNTFIKVEPPHCLEAVAEAHYTPIIRLRSPRHIRALDALLHRGRLSREELDRIAGCSNFPGIVFALRDRGLELPCERVPCADRDGRTCRPGFYSLSPADKAKAREMLKAGDA